MNHSRLVATLTVVVGLAAPALADTVSVTASSFGQFESNNGGQTANNFSGTLAAGYRDTFRGFVTFDITSRVPAGSVVTSASLRINGVSYNGAGILNVFSYSGGAAQLNAATGGFTAAGGAIFSALGSGTAIASTTFGNSDGSLFDTVANLPTSAIIGNILAFGLTVTPVNQGNFSYLRSAGPGAYGPGTGNISLELTYAPVQVVPLPPAVWGGAAGLAGVAFIARRRRMTAN